MEAIAKRLRLSEPEAKGLSVSQVQAFDAIIAGRSVFVTGSGGVGKTELIKRVVAWFRRNNINVAVTATTGIAAVNIGGRTLHSWARMVPDDDQLDAASIVERLERKYRNFGKVLGSFKALVIDEVSMLSPNFFEKLDFVLKSLRRNALRPFGGLQMVLVGDFFQLPPVYKGADAPGRRFVFESHVFWDTVAQSIELSEVFRQTDTEFVGLLQRMRVGKLSEADIAVLQSRVGADVSHMGIEPTTLYAKNFDVDRINAERLSQIQKPVVAFKRRVGTHQKGNFTGAPDKARDAINLEKFLKDQNMTESLVLKEGAQVMLTFNLDTEEGLVNGTRGVVASFKVPTSPDTEATFHGKSLEEPLAYANEPLPVVRFLVAGKDGHMEPQVKNIHVPYVRLSRTNYEDHTESYGWQVPLKLAWATTIHKSQGLSLNCVKANLGSSVFEEGQAYVAISRCRSLAGLTLEVFEPSVVRANAAVVAFTMTPEAELRGKYAAAV